MSEPSLRDQTCVVTGATSGIGLAAAEAFARLGARVVLIGRDARRASAALLRVSAAAREVAGPTPSVELGDLSVMAEVRELARRLAQQHERIDLLANVAGYYGDKRRLSPEGLELQWAVNHLAPFLLTRELGPTLRAAPRPRVLVVSSESHYFGRVFWGDPSMGALYVGLLAYAQSKLANVLFVNELMRREGPAPRLAAYAVDPGLVNTDMGGKHAALLTRLGWALRRRSGTAPEVPARAMAFLATATEDLGARGRYWRDCAPKEPSLRARDADAARRLWELSEATVERVLAR